MAKQTGLFQFTGKLANLIGYRRNGQYFVRTMPQTVKQTVASKQASRNFGIASRKGKLIRRALTPHVDIPYDGSLVNRLNKVLMPSSGAHLKALENFRFNKHSDITPFFCHQPVLLPNGMLSIPAQVFPQTAGATHIDIKAVAVRVCFIQQQITASHTSSITIDLNTPFNGTELKAAIPGKGTLIVLLQVRVHRNGDITQNRRSIAADIIQVNPPVPAKRRKVPKIKSVLPYVPHHRKGKVTQFYVPATNIEWRRE